MKKTVLTVTAICLATLLLCGAACFGTVNYVQRQNAALSASESARLTAAENAAEEVYTAALLAVGTTQAAPEKTLSTADIYELACRQVVGISTTVTGYNMFGQLTSNAVTGTGFILSEDGYTLTNNHVVEDAVSTGSTVTVKLHDGSEYPAAIVGTEGNTNDIAVLKIDAEGLSPVTLGDSDKMQVGENIYVVGNPLGELTYTMTAGIISALDREIAADRNTTLNMFQLDAAVNSGNSGGPVFNDRGQVIGVVTAKYNSSGVEGLGFAIPINDAVSIAEDLINQAYLGITVTTIGSEDAKKYNAVPGVYVYSVNPGSCAEKAGIQQGDVIVKLGDTEVSTTAELADAKKAYRPGDKCILKIYSSGQYKEVTVVFDGAPTEPTTSAQTPAQQQPGQQQPFDRPDSGDSQEEQQGSQNWMQDFFNRFFEYFGGGSSNDNNNDDGSRSGGSGDSDKGYRHFGT